MVYINRESTRVRLFSAARIDILKFSIYFAIGIAKRFDDCVGVGRPNFVEFMALPPYERVFVINSAKMRNLESPKDLFLK